MKTLINLIKMLLGRSTKVVDPPKPVLNPPAFDPKLLEAWLRRAIDKKGPPPFGYEPDEGMAHGERFIKDVMDLYGYKEMESFIPGTFNQMADFMAKSPHWKLLKDDDGKSHYETAANWAAQGCLIMAIQKNDGLGLACVLAPDNNIIFSNKWLKTVPMVAYVGKKNFYGKALNWAFENEPDLYLLISLPTGTVQ